MNYIFEIKNVKPQTLNLSDDNKAKEFAKNLANFLNEEVKWKKNIEKDEINESNSGLLDFGDFINEKEKWIQDAVKSPGKTHELLHVPEDKKIPVSKINKKLKSLKKKKEHTAAETKEMRELNLAKTLKHIKK